MNLLDAGCGTGDDANHFAERGVNVTAIDVSTQMVAQLQRKARGRISCQTVDMLTYRPTMALDGVFSNFGALNCVSQLDWLSRLPVNAGGHLVLTLMGRVYPLEIAVSLLKGQPRGAFRRLRRSSEAVVEGVRFKVHYHSLRSMKQALGRRFELVSVKGLRSLTPAPHLGHLERFRAMALLKPIDRLVCRSRLTAMCADHFVSVWRCREA
jgi:SAM-dependent methyltransferase